MTVRLQATEKAPQLSDLGANSGLPDPGPSEDRRLPAFGIAIADIGLDHFDGQTRFGKALFRLVEQAFTGICGFHSKHCDAAVRIVNPDAHKILRFDFGSLAATVFPNRWQSHARL